MFKVSLLNSVQFSFDWNDAGLSEEQGLYNMYDQHTKELLKKQNNNKENK